MPNVFRKPEQREHWNKYNSKYAKENYKTIGIKLHKVRDKDVIDYCESSGKSMSVLFKELVRNQNK